MAHDKETAPMYKVFEDRRNYPRLKMGIPAKATGPGGQTIDVTLYDLSPESAQIRFPIAGGSDLFLNKTTPIEEIKSLLFSICFKLNYKNITSEIELNAHPVYLRTVDDKTMSSGILFIENKWEEMKKVSDYLFYQLESSFSDVELLKKFKREESAGQPSSQKTDANEKEKHGPVEEPITPVPGKSKTESDIEFLKAEMVRISASLKVIQELAKHIDEKVLLLEHKLSRRD